MINPLAGIQGVRLSLPEVKQESPILK